MDRYSIEYLDQFTTKKGRTTITKEDIESFIDSGKRDNDSIFDIILQTFFSINGLQSYKFFRAHSPNKSKYELKNRIQEEKSQFKKSRKEAQEAEDRAVNLKVEDIRESELKYYYEINFLVDDAVDELKQYFCNDDEQNLIAKIRCIQEILKEKVDRFKNKDSCIE